MLIFDISGPWALPLLLLQDTLWYEMKIHVQQHEVFLSNDALKLFSPREKIIVVKTFQIL